jgi:hypothetical protein
MKSLIEQGKLLSLSAGTLAGNRLPDLQRSAGDQSSCKIWTRLVDSELVARRTGESGTLNHQKISRRIWSAPMNPTLLYRIAAFVLVLFAAGHTLGFLKFKAPTPEGVAVQQAMDNVRFHLGARNYTYGDFYRGFGLFCTAYLLFGAFLAWHLGGARPRR